MSSQQQVINQNALYNFNGQPTQGKANMSNGFSQSSGGIGKLPSTKVMMVPQGPDNTLAVN
jgi:hypothetical protein